MDGTGIVGLGLLPAFVGTNDGVDGRFEVGAGLAGQMKWTFFKVAHPAGAGERAE